MIADIDSIWGRIEIEHDDGTIEKWRYAPSFGFKIVIALLSPSQMNRQLDQDYKGKVSKKRYDMAKALWQDHVKLYKVKQY